MERSQSESASSSRSSGLWRYVLSSIVKDFENGFFLKENLLLLLLLLLVGGDCESGPRPIFIYSDFSRLLDMRERESVCQVGVKGF